MSRSFPAVCWAPWGQDEPHGPRIHAFSRPYWDHDSKRSGSRRRLQHRAWYQVSSKAMSAALTARVAWRPPCNARASVSPGEALLAFSRRSLGYPQVTNESVLVPAMPGSLACHSTVGDGTNMARPEVMRAPWHAPPEGGRPRRAGRLSNQTLEGFGQTYIANTIRRIFSIHFQSP